MNNVERLAAKIAAQDRRIAGLASAPQLAFSSIENGAIDEHDVDGNLVAIFGRQFDGGHGAVPIVDPVPPVPSAGEAVASIGGAKHRWPGTFLNESGVEDLTVIAPTYFSRVEVHASTDPLFTAEFADTLQTTFESPRGGEASMALPVGTWYVRLVTRSKSGKRSAASAVVTVEVTPLVDGDIILSEIDAANVLIKNAGNILLDAQKTLTERFGAVDMDIGTAKSEAISAAAADATAKADAAEAAAEAAAALDATAKADAAEAAATSAAALDAKAKADAAEQAAIDAAAITAQLKADGAEQAAIDAAALTAQQKADAAEAAAEAAAAADATAKADAAEAAATAAAAADATAKADAAQQAAIDAAALDATQKADAAEAAAKSAAALDATAKAEQAEADAVAAAAADATAKADAAEAAAIDAAESLTGDKGKVWIQNTKPSTGGEFDLWINTALDAASQPLNQPNKWVGGTVLWSPVTDNAALAAAADDAADKAAAAESAAKQAAALDATAKAEQAEADAVAAAAIDAQNKADSAESAAIAAAATDATNKADAAEAAAKSAAAADATAKADAAEAAATQAAALDAKAKADAAEQAAIDAAAITAQLKADGAEQDAIDAAALTAQQKADAAEAAAKSAAAADATAKADAAEAAATQAAALDAQAKADAAEAAAISAAAIDATNKADAAEAAAKSAAAADATAKADAAESAAISAAAADATAKADAAREAALQAAATTDNRLVNAGWEQGFDGWNHSGPAVIDTTVFRSGLQSVRADPGSQTQLSPTTGTIPVNPGETWLMGVWYQTTADYNGTSSWGKIRWGSQPGTQFVTADTFLPGKTAWTWIVIERTIPSDETGMELILAADHTAGNIWWDDAQVKNVTGLRAAEAAAVQAEENAIAAAALDATAKADAAESAAKSAAALDASSKAEQAEADAVAAAAITAQNKADAAEQAAIDAAAVTAQLKADGAEQAAIDAAKLDATAKANAAESAAKQAAALDATSKAEQAEADAVAAAAADAQTKADNAKAAAISAAATDATNKADAAEAAAKSAAALDATAKADAAEAAATQAAATDAQNKANTAKQEAIDAAAITAQLKADGAEQDAIDAAALTAQQKADAAEAAAKSAAAADATAKADAAEAAATSAAAADAKSKADAAKAAAISAAATDATNKANNAKSEAISAAATDATNKMNSVAGSKNSVKYSSVDPGTTNTGGRAGDLWRKRNAAKEIIGEWQWTGTVWEKQTVSGTIVSNMDIGYLTAGAAVMSSAVIDELFADVVVARMSIAEQFIGSNAILDTSITAPKIVASEEMWTKVLGAHKINAVEIDVNDLAADVGFIADMEAVIVTADMFVGKSFSGGQFEGGIFKTIQKNPFGEGNARAVIGETDGYFDMDGVTATIPTLYFEYDNSTLHQFPMVRSDYKTNVGIMSGMDTTFIDDAGRIDVDVYTLIGNTSVRDSVTGSDANSRFSFSADRHLTADAGDDRARWAALSLSSRVYKDARETFASFDTNLDWDSPGSDRIGLSLWSAGAGEGHGSLTVRRDRANFTHTDEIRVAGANTYIDGYDSLTLDSDGALDMAAWTDFNLTVGNTATIDTNFLDLRASLPSGVRITNSAQDRATFTDTGVDLFGAGGASVGVGSGLYLNPGTEGIQLPSVTAVKGRIDYTGTNIGDSQDLNMYDQPGVYHQDANAAAAGGVNYPFPGAGLLEVFKSHTSSMVYQRYTGYEDMHRIYTRGRYAGQWSQWMAVGVSGPWQNITLAAAMDASDNPQARRVGDSVQLAGAIRPDSGAFPAGYTTLGWLPTDLRPVGWTYSPVVMQSPSTQGKMVLKNDGTIEIDVSNNNSSYTTLYHVMFPLTGG